MPCDLRCKASNILSFIFKSVIFSFYLVLLLAGGTLGSGCGGSTGFFGLAGSGVGAGGAGCTGGAGLAGSFGVSGFFGLAGSGSFVVSGFFWFSWLWIFRRFRLFLV